jgi:hypothetical protein
LKIDYTFPLVSYDWYQASVGADVNGQNWSGIGYWYYSEDEKPSNYRLDWQVITRSDQVKNQDIDLIDETLLNDTSGSWKFKYIDFNYVTNSSTSGSSILVDMQNLKNITHIRFSPNGAVGGSGTIWIDDIYLYDFDCGGFNYPRSLWMQTPASNVRLSEGVAILAYLYNNPDSVYYLDAGVKDRIFQAMDYFVNNYRPEDSWSEYSLSLGSDPGRGFVGSAFAYTFFMMEDEPEIEYYTSMKYKNDVYTLALRNATYRQVIADLASKIESRGIQTGNYSTFNANIIFNMYFPLFADYYFNDNNTAYSYWVNITDYDKTIKNYVRQAKGMTWFVESQSGNWNTNAGWDNAYNGATQLEGLAVAHSMQKAMMDKKGGGSYVTPIPNLLKYWENTSRSFIDYTNYYHLENPSRGNANGIFRNFVGYNITEDWTFQNYYPGIYDTINYPYLNRYVFDQLSSWTGYGSIAYKLRGGVYPAVDSTYCVENATSFSQNVSFRVEYPQNATDPFYYLLYNFSDASTGQAEALIGIEYGTRGVQLDRISELYVPYLLSGDPYNISINSINSGKNYTYEFGEETFYINVTFIPELADFVQNIIFNFEYDGVDTEVTGTKNGALWSANYTKTYYLENATNVTNATHTWRWQINGTYDDGNTFSNDTTLTDLIVYPVWEVTTFTLDTIWWMETDSPIIYYSLKRYNSLEGETGLQPTIFINYSGTIIELATTPASSTHATCSKVAPADTYCNYLQYDGKIRTPFITNYSENKSLNTYFEVYYDGVTYKRGGDGYAWTGSTEQLDTAYTENGTAYMMVVDDCYNLSFANISIVNFTFNDEDTIDPINGSANNLFTAWVVDRTYTRTYSIPITGVYTYEICKKWTYPFYTDFEVTYWATNGSNATTTITSTTTLSTDGVTNVQYNETGNATAYNSTTNTSGTTTQTQITTTTQTSGGSGYSTRTLVQSGIYAESPLDYYILWLGSLSNLTSVLVHAVDEIDGGWINSLQVPVVIEAWQWQPTFGQFFRIESAYTDLAGKVQFHLNPSQQKQYYFVVKVNDTIVFPSDIANPNKFALTTPYDYWLRIPRYNLDFLALSSTLKTLSSNTEIAWNNATHRVSANWHDMNTSLSNLCFGIYNMTNSTPPYTTEYGVASTARIYKYCTTDNDGSIFYNLGLVEGEYVAVLEGTLRSSGDIYIINTLTIYPTGASSTKAPLGGLGFFLAFLLVGTMVFAGLELGSTGVIVVCCASLIITLFMPLAIMSKMALVGLAIVGLIIGLLINR